MNHFRVFDPVALRQIFSLYERGQAVIASSKRSLASDPAGETLSMGQSARGRCRPSDREAHPLLTECLEQWICEPIQQLLGADSSFGWVPMRISTAETPVGDPDAWWPKIFN